MQCSEFAQRQWGRVAAPLTVPEQAREGDALHGEYYVTKVLRHIERAEQKPLGELPPESDET